MQIVTRKAKRNTIAFLRKRLGDINGYMASRSLHGDHVLFDPALFPWTERIEAGFQGIRRELDCVLETPDSIPNFSDISNDQAHLASYGKWQTFFLYAYGYRADANCEKCPQTARLVESIPGMKTAFFSILQPDMRIKPHRGPYKGLLRYHLALKVPEPATSCAIKLDGQTRHWEQGKSLVFDDSFEHEAWNESATERVVLFVDFERPLPASLALVNRGLIRAVGYSPLVRDGLKNFEQWTRRTALDSPSSSAAQRQP